MLRQALASETKLDPKPGFVIKTKVLNAQTFSSGTKAFINVCHDPKVPRPPVEFEPAVVFPLIMQNQWEIPLVVSAEKHTVDKKGVPAVVYDCCMNLQCFQWTQVNKDLRLILIEWCIEAIELVFDMELERAYTIPKMLNKGELSKTILSGEDATENALEAKLEEMKRNETLGLIEEMKFGSDDEDISGPLPDLRNISNAPQKKPLIEEVESHETKRKELEQAPKAYVSERQRYDFSVTFLKVATPANGETIEVAVQCSQFTSDAVTVSYNSESRSLILHNCADAFYFLKSDDKSKDALEIPVPPIAAVTPHVRTVFQDHPATLRVFLE